MPPIPRCAVPARHATQDALRRVIDYYLYRDLQRGWRVTAPNLEDCGLLIFDYAGLQGEDGLLGETDLWTRGFRVRDDHRSERWIETPAALQACPEELREEILRTLLDVMRRALAVKVDVLDPDKQRDLVEQTKPRLLEDSIWYLEDTRELTKAVVAYPRPKRERDRGGFFISSYGAYGRYLKRCLLTRLPDGTPLGRDEIDAIIRSCSWRSSATASSSRCAAARRRGDPGYQFNADALRWLPGDGEIRPVDRTACSTRRDPAGSQSLFRRVLPALRRSQVRARSARAHGPGRRRGSRRSARSASARGLPLLFCSPTMELGVDIAQLNLVNLRNVPPTPANYAQRSGRAGRGGQPALVFTYCAGRSPHDQYFYREPSKMVAGVVAPPANRSAQP
jgi:hypothetical protein